MGTAENVGLSLPRKADVTDHDQRNCVMPNLFGANSELIFAAADNQIRGEPKAKKLLDAVLCGFGLLFCETEKRIGE
jgi:hypothetical protein